MSPLQLLHNAEIGIPEIFRGPLSIEDPKDIILSTALEFERKEFQKSEDYFLAVMSRNAQIEHRAIEVSNFSHPYSIKIRTYKTFQRSN